MQPLSLYFHFPFCQKKCNYCHFFTFSGLQAKMPAYVSALKMELELLTPSLKNYEIQSIFFGGGTPSLIPTSDLKAILKLCKHSLRLASNVEITLEANPETITAKRLAEWWDAGVNRLSIGVQAWQDHLLASLGRGYQNADLDQRMDWLKNSFFNNINVDFIFGIPGQSMKDWQESLDKALSWPISHLSAYSLELNNDSYFGRLYQKGHFQAANEDLDRSMYHFARNRLKKAGLKQYEISNFAKPGFECRHNQLFWLGQPYIGLGAAAHSYFDRTRFHNVYSVDDYITKTFAGLSTREIEETITDHQVFRETIMLRLRLIEGIEIESLENEFGINILDEFKSEIKDLIRQKLLRHYNDRLWLTAKGMDLENQVAMAFI